MTECTCEGKGNCSVCRANRKAEVNADKPKKVNKPINRTPIKKKIVDKKPIDLEALKGKNVQLKGSKRVLSEEDIIAKQKEKERLKKEKDKLKRKAKRELITEKKLDTIFSKWIRSIYPPICHASKVPVTFSTSHCAHLIGRNNRCVRFDTRNCYPTTPEQNMYCQTHVIGLARKLEEYYGIEIDDWVSTASQNTCKLSYNDRKEMFDVFKEALLKLEDINRLLTVTEFEKDELKTNLRLDVIKKTKKIM